MPKVLYYLQHLLGIGHVRRSALIVKNLSQKGFEVHVAFGGTPVPHMDFGTAAVHQLRPVKSADDSFSGLVTAEGTPLSEETKKKRCRDLLTLAESLAPDIMVTESFPFGRRMMRFELKPLLQWAQKQSPRPLLISSIRDILQRRKPEREAETVQTVQEYYDHVWVHGNAGFCALEESFPLAETIRDKCAYTGYVAEAPPDTAADRRGIVVSAGGGAVGFHMIETALGLACEGFIHDRPWTLLAGLNLAEKQFQELQNRAPANLTLLRHTADFPQRLGQAELSVSMAGYNTVMDILQARVPAVLVPFEGTGETEQLMRAEKLAALNRVAILREPEMTAENLKEAMTRALAFEPARPAIKTDGADRAAELLAQWWDNHG